MLIVLFSAGLAACSGESPKKYGLEGNLLDYNEVNPVTFTLSGNAYCRKCAEEEIPIQGMQIELYGQGNHLDRLGLQIFDGLGHFSLQNIRARAGQIIEVEGQLYRESVKGTSTSYRAYGEIVAPNDDGGIVTISLQFPSDNSEK